MYQITCKKKEKKKKKEKEDLIGKQKCLSDKSFTSHSN